MEEKKSITTLLQKLLNQITYVDLTHELDENIPSWNGSCGFKLETKLDYQECTTSTKFRVQQIKMHAGIGTHVDAPAHCFPGGLSIGEIFLESLIFIPLYVIDVRAKVENCSSYGISIDDIKQHEQDYGLIPEKALVVGFTGWSKHWDNGGKYRNVDKRGIMQIPFFKGEVADYLLAKNIVGLGVDTLSPDNPADNEFPMHYKILKAGKFIVENIASLHLVVPKKSWCLIFVPKIKHATEAPARIVALVEK